MKIEIIGVGKIAIILLLCYSFFAASATRLEDLTGDWINGHYEYTGQKVAPNVVQFEGGDLHEGAYAFTIVARNDSLFIGGHSWPETEEDKKYGSRPSFGEKDDKVILKLIGGVPVMLVIGFQGHIEDFLRRAKPGEDLTKDVLGHMTKYELSGKYIDSATHKLVTFYADQQAADGLTDAKDYDFEAPEDTPDHVITFTNDKSFYYERTDSGLDIYTAVRHEDEHMKGRKLMSLKKISWFDFSGNPALKGRYTFASTEILTRDILDVFTPNQKRIIRNEIFARHGYIFKTADMISYFGAQDWYHPIFDAVDDKLTEVEKLNIQLLAKTWANR